MIPANFGNFRFILHIIQNTELQKSVKSFPPQVSKHHVLSGVAWPQGGTKSQQWQIHLYQEKRPVSRCQWLHR